MTALELALHYHADGWPVFPCRNADEYSDKFDPQTGEYETLRAKTPYTSNGLKAATKIERIIRRWWQDYPEAVVGVPTGAPIGAWVLDIDVKGETNGFETLAALEAENGPLPPTLVSETPSGGRHYYFNHVPGVRNRGALGKAIDVRGDGGYVIAPGSVMANGNQYRWVEENPIADAPQWLLDLVVRKVPVSSGAASAPRVGGLNSSYVNAAVQGELDDLALTPMGNRNNALNDSAFALGQFVGAGGLPEHEARELLRDVARGWGRDWTNCCKTIENGLKAGMGQPRDIPEPTQFIDDFGGGASLVDISRMIANGLRKGKAVSQREAGPDPEPVSEVEPGAVEPEPEPEEAPPKFRATPFVYEDPKTLPRREFTYGTHYIRKYVSVTVAAGGIGKTANSILESLAMVSKRPLIGGLKPPEKLRVWLFNAEDPRDELKRRIHAAMIHYKLKPEDLGDRLFVDTGREQELVIAQEDKKTGFKINIPIVESIVAEIAKRKIDVMIVDPFVSTHSVNENDNGAIDKVAKLWAQIADETNCAIDIVHHARKISEREATVEDARGAGSLLGAARSVRVFNRMTVEQAQKAGVNPDERGGYFYITHGKSNLTPLSHHQDWRKMQSVGLGNGVGLAKPQDMAPVVTEWAWPSAEKIAEGLTVEEKEKILVTVANGNYKQSHKAKPSIIEGVAFALDLDVDDEADKRRAHTIAKALITEGVLRVVSEKDPVRGAVAGFVRVAKEAA